MALKPYGLLMLSVCCKGALMVSTGVTELGSCGLRFGARVGSTNLTLFCALTVLILCFSENSDNFFKLGWIILWCIREASCASVGRTWSSGSLSRFYGDVTTTVTNIATVSGSIVVGRSPWLLSKVVTCAIIGGDGYMLYTVCTSDVLSIVTRLSGSVLVAVAIF